MIFCCGFLKFVTKMIMRQWSILHESVKKQISIFHSEKGSFPFIVTVNYHTCSILLYLNSIDVKCFLSCLRKKDNQWILTDIFFKLRNGGNWRKWPSRKYRVEIHFESIRTIPIHSDMCIGSNANHSEPIRKRSKSNPT